MACNWLRKLPRWFFTSLTVLSLLLCLEIVGQWIRSYSYQDTVRIDSNVQPLCGWLVYTKWGSLVIRRFDKLPTPEKTLGTYHWRSLGRVFVEVRTPTEAPVLPKGIFGFGWHVEPRRTPSDWTWTYNVVVPLWFLALLFAILPAIKLRSILRTQRRRSKGFCQSCGYDLRATPERCPECGTVVKGVRSAV